MRLTAIDAFCGAGGLSSGLRAAGFEIVYAFDLDEMSVETYRGAVGHHVEVRDVQDVRGSELLRTLQLPGIDLLAGGPPCQGFSKQKRGAHNGDDRNKLVLEFARLVDETAPRFFLLENVAMFGQKRGREFVAAIHERLGSYRLFPHFYNSADYGLAQTRERFIIVGQQADLKAPFRIPSPSTSRRATVGEVLSGLPEPPLDYSDHPEYPNHQRARVTKLNIERFAHVPQGGGWRDIPEQMRLECHRNVDTSRGGWPDVYGRLDAEGQAPTITGGFDSFTRGRYGHPYANRPLTPREAARLQGFPDDFVFVGTRQAMRTQIGNAVPPPLARAIGESIRASLLAECGLSTELGSSPPTLPASPQLDLAV
jgi:DNA (cytosine-5)-methyltransferase 1